MVGRKPLINEELGLWVRFANIDPQTGQFTFEVKTTQRDYVVMKAVEKPLINVLWLGTLVLAVGFVMAMVRRFKDYALVKE
jgi:cytochrome c-type biogenesis protein CcmF